MGAHRWVAAVAAVAALLAVIVAGPSGSAGAADPTLVALWEMNESPTATTLVDSSGNGVDGTIGASVDTGRREGPTTYHRFSPIAFDAPPDTGRLHVIPHRASLNPGGQPFSVEVRFRADYTGRNLMQKGQSTTVGGYWKLEWEGGTGKVRCLFRGPNGDSYVHSDGNTVDGQWHTLRCDLSSSGTVMYLDGVREARSTIDPGVIANDKNLVIGGKGTCDNVTITCDYYVGDLDYVRIDRAGSTATTTTTTSTTTTVKPTTTTSTTTTVKPTTTTTTMKPTTTTTSTTTTTVVQSSQMPVGRIDSIVVDGSTITVSGPASDVDGTPIAQLEDVVDGRRTTIERWASKGRFNVAYTGTSGTHQVCVSLLDSPTRQPVPIGCGEAVVK